MALSQAQGDPKQFNYLRLDPGTDEIWLVTILPPSSTSAGENEIDCSLSHALLHDAPSYEALSYTWADENGDSSLNSTILLNSYPFLVTKNLEAALRQLRLPSAGRVFWIDAICIDQKDDPERNHQVAMMRMIYQEASQVAVWLGSENHSSSLAFSVLHGVLERLGADVESWTQNMLSDERSKPLLYALAMLLLCQYWDRIWIVQEVLSGTEAMVYYGSNSINWDDFLKALELIENECVAVGLSRVTYPVFSRLVITQGPQSIARSWHIFSQGPSDLLGALRGFRNKVSSDPRDKVYGLVGLTTARDDPRFQVDYSSTVSKVYRDTTEYIVTATRSLDVIGVGKGRMHSDWLPSWAPDWSQSDTRSGKCLSPDFNAALGTTANATFDICGRVLRVQGMITAIIKSAAMPLKISSFNIASSDGHEIYRFLFTICDWLELIMEAENHEVVSEEALNSTLFMNTNTDHLISLTEWNFLEVLAAIINQYMPMYAMKGPLGGAFLRWQTRFDDEDRPAALELCRQVIPLAAETINGSRFIISSERQMGLAPYSAEVGDLICVLLGCRVPIVLRPHEGFYTVVGSVYVYGLMNGEAINRLSEGKYTQQEFVLH